MTAAREYKTIMGALTEASAELRGRDRARAAELGRELVERDDAMARTGERTALTRLGVELHWEAALEALWSESWMTLRPMPAADWPATVGAAVAPDRAEPERAPDLDELDAEVVQRFTVLVDAVRRRRLGLRR